jgi:hypothetical protein
MNWKIFERSRLSGSAALQRRAMPSRAKRRKKDSEALRAATSAEVFRRERRPIPLPSSKRVFSVSRSLRCGVM